METKTSFDLTHALDQWREELIAQPGVLPEETRELETHLLDSFADLQRRGLREDEAFWLARRRLGGTKKIAEELTKTDPSRLWTERVLWMVLGLIVTHVWNSVMIAPGNYFGNLLIRSGHISAFLWWSITWQIATYGLLGWIALMAARGYFSKPVVLLARLFSTPQRLAWTLTAVVPIHWGLKSFFQWQLTNGTAGTGLIALSYSFVLTMLWPLVLGFVAIRLTKRLRSSTSQPV